jgi:hypothetical protein
MRISRHVLRLELAIGMLTLPWLTGCNFPRLQPTPDMVATLAAVTLSAPLSSPLADDTLSPPSPEGGLQGTPATGQAPLSTRGPEPSGTEAIAECSNKLKFLSDVSVPDNTRMSPGEQFLKKWRVRNTGSCQWSSSYRLAFQSGNIMGGPAEGLPLPASVSPGEEVVLSVELTAPEVPGRYQGYWLLRDARGAEFGYGDDADQAFWVKIRVVRPATEAPTQEGDS